MYLKIKRALDIILAFLGIIVTLPLMLLVALAIKIEEPKGPVLFKQKRVGENKKYFQIYKFRSMSVEVPDIPTHLLQNPDKWITRTGKILRKTSIDELPQLINILKGEMSFIGPRPALWSQYDLIELREQVGANNIKPGITGLAQVNGRDELPLDIKAAYDGEYVKEVCFKLDMQILFKTIRTVLKAEGIVEGSNEKMNVKEMSIKEG